MTKIEKVIAAMVCIMGTFALTCIVGGMVYFCFWFVGFSTAKILSEPSKLAIGVLAIILFSTIGLMAAMFDVHFCVISWKELLKEIES